MINVFLILDVNIRISRWMFWQKVFRYVIESRSLSIIPRKLLWTAILLFNATSIHNRYIRIPNWWLVYIHNVSYNKYPVSKNNDLVTVFIIIYIYSGITLPCIMWYLIIFRKILKKDYLLFTLHYIVIKL